MNILINIAITAITIIATIFGVVNYVPMGWLGFSDEPLQFSGTQTVVELATTDTMSDFPAFYNTGQHLLNNNKMEMSTTSVASITTLSNLVSVGALSSGSLTTGFTAVPVALGGTGTTSPTLNQVMLGNGASGLKVIGFGTSGQFLTSGGAVAPSWTTSSVDLGIAYDWTGLHSFAATTTLATTTISWLGIATTTPGLPGLQTGLSIGDDVYIDSGGLGIGIATTTDDNLEVAGSTLISGDLHLTGTMYMGYEATSSAATALGTVDDNVTTVTAYCSSGYKVVGGGFTRSDTGEVWQYRLNYNKPDTTNEDRWAVSMICKVGGGCTAGNLTAHAICLKMQ